MSAIRLQKPERPPFTDEQLAYLERRIAEATDEQRTRTERVFEAIYRACVGVARVVKPGKRWDDL